MFFPFFLRLSYLHSRLCHAPRTIQSPIHSHSHTLMLSVRHPFISTYINAIQDISLTLLHNTRTFSSYIFRTCTHASVMLPAHTFTHSFTFTHTPSPHHQLIHKCNTEYFPNTHSFTFTHTLSVHHPIISTYINVIQNISLTILHVNYHSIVPLDSAIKHSDKKINCVGFFLFHA